MAANPQSQHRCVFVGNIPYDATEEQLVQLLEEVGPVVSFRLVIDRETGKPKGYGFCEYKDGETASSARRNLQGYEINGRQLRVDFAENDKNADKIREQVVSTFQGRGGAGIVPNVDAQKQIGGPAGHPSLHQPIGDSAAMAAATVMAGALGSAQNATTLNDIGLQIPSMLGTDPLTRHLAKMSRIQLTDVVSELKAMATQNKEQAKELLLAFPNLPKALFQAQIMLGLVSPQMLQMPNIQQASVQPMQQLVQHVQSLPGLPPLPQNKTQLGVLPYAQESRVSTGVLNQYTAPFLTQPQIQLPQLTPTQVIPKDQGFARVSTLPSIHSQSINGVSVGQLYEPISSSFNQQMQHSLPHNETLVPSTNSGNNDHQTSQNVNALASKSVHPQYSDAGFQLGSKTSPGMPEGMNLKGRAYSVPSQSNQSDRASKMSTPFPNSDILARPGASSINAEKHAPQMQLPADADSMLLEQVLNLTPEQLSSLPPDQRQQVIQLQQMLRQGT